MNHRAVVIGAIWLTAAASCTSCFLIQSHPSDEQLINLHGYERTTLERLVQMMVEDDEAVRVATDFVVPDHAISKERHEEYRRLLRDLDCSDGVSRPVDQRSVVFFLMSGRGVSVAGSTKGLAYSIKPVGPLVESLDGGVVSSKHVAFRAIEDGWYVFLRE